MNKRTKQIITWTAANVLFLPPIFFAFLNEKTETNLEIIFLSFMPLLIVLGSLRVFWGPDVFTKPTWRAEGFSSFSEWFKKSEIFHGKFFRFSTKYFLPILIAISILAGIVIKISN